MKGLMNYVFYFSISAAFLANAGFLAAELAAWAGSGNRKKKLGLVLLLAAVFAAGRLFYGGAAPRGGYDNDHDFQYLSISFFQPGSVGMAISLKEASPLIFDALGDAASGFSLKAAPVKNRLLMFLAAVLLFACLRALGFGQSSACFGFALFYFNFLAALNANTFSTTAANMFFLFSSLYAAAVFETARRDFKGLLWALSAFFLVWTGRYELAVMPALILCASLLHPAGALRALASRPGAGGRVWLFLGLAAALCAGWTMLVLARLNYNGPQPREAAQLLAHLQYQLGEKNLGVFLPSAAGLVPYLVAGAFILTFLNAWFSARRSPGLVSWAILLLCALCFCSIFMLQDGYPLQFMRHRLYFFTPFVFLFAAAWEACWARFTGRTAVALKWCLLACLCAVYLKANAKAAQTLEPEKRTNDLEWALLLKASQNWPEGCALIYPDCDKHHRYLVLNKYFPLLSGGCGRKAPACVIKYLPPIYRVFNDAGPKFPRDYTPASPSYAGPGARPLYESVFPHRFYTAWDSETREEIPLRIGFYYADSPKDRAWLLNREGLCIFKNGAFGGAENTFREALKLDPDCGICGLNLNASLVFGGKEPEALRRIARAAAAGPAGAQAALLAALKRAAAGEDAGALAELNAFIAANYDDEYLSMGFAYRSALKARQDTARIKD
ncbi:MAG: hypothetical protein HY796_07330 [Elusimicrobia bacterium]|nr:hypothetical protein [Elusimicrobiota bacterium]